MFGSYYNLIELPSQQPASVSISHSAFDYISSCGSVIGNIAQEQIALPTSSPYLEGVSLFLARHYSAVWSSTGSPSSGSLKVEHSSFSHLDFLFDDGSTSMRLDFEYPSYKHHLKASALFLYKTEFPVSLFNSSFVENRLNLAQLPSTLALPTVTTPSGAPYSSRGGIMVESVICVYKLTSHFIMEGNRLQHNGGTKGPVMIELAF